MKTIIKPYEKNVNNNEKSWIIEIQVLILGGKIDCKNVNSLHIIFIFNVILIIIWAWFLMKLDIKMHKN